MADAEFNQQWQRDCDTLRIIVEGLAQLEVQWHEARISVAARQRGYFTPDEDDRVRQMLLSYRNYRLGLYEVIRRYWAYRDIADPENRLHALVLALATALTLYSHSLKLIQAYEREPLIRKKLNEPDAKFDLEEGFFDVVLRAYSSLGNYRELLKGVWFWRTHRRQIQRIPNASNLNWLIQVVRKERTVVRKRLINVLLCRLRYDWRAFWQTTVLPVRKTRYSLQSLIGEACAGIRTSMHHSPAVTPSVLVALKPQLQPGDILLMRTEEKLTAALLPGFWAHAAMFIGQRADLERLGLGPHPHVTRHLAELDRQCGAYGAVLEAISPRVLINGLERSLCADHVLVLRPNLPIELVATAMAEAFGHLGKPYDFEFDFNVTTRLVCTEIIYRAYHKRGPIQFLLTKRLGRYTLTADDIASAALSSILRENAPAPYKLVSLILRMADGQAHFVPAAETVSTLERLQGGWRPGNPAEPAVISTGR